MLLLLVGVRMPRRKGEEGDKALSQEVVPEFFLFRHSLFAFLIGLCVLECASVEWVFARGEVSPYGKAHSCNMM